ncbi:MAG: hypothetical protein ACHQ4F_15685, partial [Candidatus Dormibacteria bacterium]
TPSPTGAGYNGGNGGGGSTPTPAPTATPAPTRAPVPTSKPVTTPAASGGSHSDGDGAAASETTSGTQATRPQVPADPTPFAPLTGAVTVATSGQSLDAARIPPVEALTPLSGLELGNGLNLGPLLLLIDLIGIGVLVYLIRTRWLAPEA